MSANIVRERVSQYNFNTVKQVSENINYVFNDLENYALYLWQNKEFMSYLKLSEKDFNNSMNVSLSAQKSVNNFIIFKTNIYSIYVNGFNGLVFDSASAQNVINSELKKKIIELRGESLLISDVVTNYDNSATKVISLVRLFKDIDNLSSNLALIKINISEDEISKIFESKTLGTKGTYYVVDENNRIISALENDELGTVFGKNFITPMSYTGQSGFFNSEVNNHDMLVTYLNLSRPGWRLINLVPLDELSADTEIIQSLTIFAVFLSFGLCLLAIFFFTNSVLSPLKKIRTNMKDIENENFSVSIDIKGNDEIALLGSSFNKMSRRLNELVNEVYRVQLKQKEAELKALQAQINPHFLYNTLDIIHWMCRIENAFESSNLVQALAKLFRLSLNSGNEFTTVRNELDHLKNYITIQERRFEDLISFNISCPDDLLDCKVIKLILQPLVENAIHHGIEKKGCQGNITVRIYKENQNVVYIIQDDGAGADIAELNALLLKVEEKNRGFGIKNVNDRIKLYFGNDYGINFHSSHNNGTTVIVTQPFSK